MAPGRDAILSRRDFASATLECRPCSLAHDKAAR